MSKYMCKENQEKNKWIADQLCADVSKSASNELLGGREAGNNNEGDGKSIRRPLGSRKCRVCDGTGSDQFIDDDTYDLLPCSACEGTGREAAL